MKIDYPFLIVLMMVFTTKLVAQPLVPIAKFSADQTDDGYYFLNPYKMPKDRKDPIEVQQILDGHGRVIAYNLINAVSDFKLHQNGIMSYFTNGKYMLINQSFKVIDSVSCINGVATDSHDFIILPNGNYLLIGTEIITEDYSKQLFFLQKGIAGSKNARVKYGVVQELDKNKKIVFQWNSKKIYKPEDANPFFLTDSANVDLTHFNSVDINSKGEILVSVRYFNEVIKIKRSDSSVVWRMGGKKNQIKIGNDSLPFYGQHDARFISDNQFTLFDNGYSFDSLKHNVRALEYEVNDQTKTAKLVWKYSNENKLISEASGNVQRLSDGNTLVHYGYLGKGKPKIIFEVVNIKHEKKFQLNYNDSIGTYRVYYYPKNKLNLNRPTLNKIKNNNKYILTIPKGYKYYIWNNGKTTPTINLTKKGEYFVYLSKDNISFIASKIYTL